jgi:hypothetical protein
MAGFGSSIVKSPEDVKANEELMARAWADPELSAIMVGRCRLTVSIPRFLS